MPDSGPENQWGAEISVAGARSTGLTGFNNRYRAIVDNRKFGAQPYRRVQPGRVNAMLCMHPLSFLFLRLSHSHNLI
jgi:hypothetical protein